MDNAELLRQLRQVLDELGIELRWQAGDFRGGICRLAGRRLCILNPFLPSAENVQILCRDLARQDLSGVFLIPALRRRVEGLPA